jgi:hypothetical protein
MGNPRMIKIRIPMFIVLPIILTRKEKTISIDDKAVK